MTSETKTRAQKTNDEIIALLKSRHTLLQIITREELRTERALIDAAKAAKTDIAFWDCASGFTSAKGTRLDGFGDSNDPLTALQAIRNFKQRRVYVMRDLNRWWEPGLLRTLRNLARDLQTAPLNEARAVIILTPSSEIPPDLAGQISVIDYPLPERPEIATLLDDAIRGLPPELAETALTNGTRDAAIDAAVGLTAEEAANCFARSIVTTRKIDPKMVATEKQRVIARERVLTWIDPDPRGLDAIGGLDVLKSWLTQRKLALSQKARAFGLPAPKGVLLVGHPGTGKSLTAKAVATAWGIPLLRLDMGALKSKFVGDSEANIRKALAVAEAVAPCVVWIDEIEKALAGASGPQGDGGVSADALGTVLSWMQERQGSVFVVATANDVRALPPELLRKGRFDELFFVDLPTEEERRAIVNAALRQYGRDPAKIEPTVEYRKLVGRDAQPESVCNAVALDTEGFTGAEIAALVPDALFAAFADDEREVVTADILRAAKATVPLSKTAGDRIEALRTWAKGKARPASTPKTESVGVGRALDV